MSQPSEKLIEQRIGEMEARDAATQSDIRTLFNMLESLATQVDRIVQNSRPNLVSYILTLVAVCTLVITIGGLALWPLHKSVERLDNAHEREEQRINELEKQASYMEGYMDAKREAKDGR